MTIIYNVFLNTDTINIFRSFYKQKFNFVQNFSEVDKKNINFSDEKCNRLLLIKKTCYRHHCACRRTEETFLEDFQNYKASISDALENLEEMFSM